MEARVTATQTVQPEAGTCAAAIITERPSRLRALKTPAGDEADAGEALPKSSGRRLDVAMTRPSSPAIPAVMAGSAISRASRSAKFSAGTTTARMEVAVCPRGAAAWTTIAGVPATSASTRPETTGRPVPSAFASASGKRIGAEPARVPAAFVSTRRRPCRSRSTTVVDVAAAMRAACVAKASMSPRRRMGEEASASSVPDTVSSSRRTSPAILAATWVIDSASLSRSAR